MVRAVQELSCGRQIEGVGREGIAAAMIRN